MTARPRWAAVASVVAIAFGMVTLFSGGSVLFGRAAARAAAGDAVPFVLWFNFLSGVLYVIAGIGLFLWRRWGARLSALLAVAILVVFALFGWHVASGGAFETRTVVAMGLRGGLWIAIAIAACRTLNCFAARIKASDIPMNGTTR